MKLIELLIRGGYIQDNLQEVILRLWILADISFNSSFLNL